MYEYRSTLLSVIDGDSIRIDCDLGMDVRTRLTVRLAGIDCPEIPSPEGRAARQFTEQWFREHCPDGVCVIRTRRDRREKFGRFLATVFTTDLERELNQELLDEGHAKPYPKPTIPD